VVRKGLQRFNPRDDSPFTTNHSTIATSYIEFMVPEKTDRDLENLTHDIGREIFARLDGSSSWLLTPAWWDERLMEWTMADPSVKVQLFRFIDALPLLHTPASITRHLREYFTEARDHLPPWLRWGLRWLPVNGWAGWLLATVARHNAERLAHRFIAGANLPEVLAAIVSLRRRSLAFTVDLLGEATITETEAEQYQAEYLKLIEGLSREVNSWPANPLIDTDYRGPLPRVNVSIKLSSLYSQFDPIDPEGTCAAVRRRLLLILHAARQRNVFVNVDMEQHAFKDLTLRIFRDMLMEPDFRDWTDVGIAIQAYHRQSEEDLAELANWAQTRGTPIWVRLVKGAYWDYETVVAAQNGWPIPVFTRKWETDANFEKLTDFLLEHRELLRPALGSHNIRSLAYALARAQTMRLPPGSLEIQMLYGMAEPLQNTLVSMGQRVRIYTPLGQLLPGMAYLVRRLLENTANESFLRASFTEHVPEEQLLMNPNEKSGAGIGRIQNPSYSQKSGATGNGRVTTDIFQNEPLTDFSREDARRAMQKALDQVKGQLGQLHPLVIGGKKVQTNATIDSLNPSHKRQVVGRCGKASVAHAERALIAAKSSFPAWRDTPAKDRAGFLFRAARNMQRQRYELAAWEVYECGKQWREADADVAESIDYCQYYAQEMVRLATGRHRDVPGEDNEYFYEPRGVVVVIAPWNFPLAILCGMTTAALVTGNTVIMKPAEQSSVIGAKLMEVFQQVGIPSGVVNYLPGAGEEIGPTLNTHRDVAMIAFTGSRGVGLSINRQAADTPDGQDHVKRVLAEMGGKNAIIVDDDADLDEAVHGVTASAFGYQGQKCSACSRVIVLDAIHDVFLNRLIEAIKSLKISPAEDPGSTVGPLIDEEAYRRVLGAIESAKQDAELRYAGDVGALRDEGYYVAPHIFANVQPTTRLAQEEIFGPVLAVLKARDLDHALEIANGTQYALTGGLYSRSPEHIVRVKQEFRVGNLYINRKITGALVDRQPFGGFKLSGIGSKAGGPDYLLQFLQPRTITENTLRRGFAPQSAQ
jgi:RHH-type proline utilization regulon transcriptional repressor/proline dehydrogenase/delta 1-pyrroline-5-carboxylate dehydrogenase